MPIRDGAPGTPLPPPCHPQPAPLLLQRRLQPPQDMAHSRPPGWWGSAAAFLGSHVPPSGLWAVLANCASLVASARGTSCLALQLVGGSVLLSSSRVCLSRPTLLTACGRRCLRGCSGGGGGLGHRGISAPGVASGRPRACTPETGRRPCCRRQGEPSRPVVRCGSTG